MGLLRGLQSNMTAYSLILVITLAVNGGLAKPMAYEAAIPLQSADEVLTLEEIQYMEDILSKQGLQEVDEVNRLEEVRQKVPVSGAVEVLSQDVLDHLEE